MSNSTSDDYFSYMAVRGRSQPAVPACTVATHRPPIAAKLARDTIEFVDDSLMVVTETPLSDTMIQRIFRIPGAGSIS